MVTLEKMADLFAAIIRDESGLETKIVKAHSLTLNVEMYSRGLYLGSTSVTVVGDNKFRVNGCTTGCCMKTGGDHDFNKFLNVIKNHPDIEGLCEED